MFCSAGELLACTDGGGHGVNMDSFPGTTANFALPHPFDVTLQASVSCCSAWPWVLYVSYEGISV